MNRIRKSYYKKMYLSGKLFDIFCWLLNTAILMYKAERYLLITGLLIYSTGKNKSVSRLTNWELIKLILLLVTLIYFPDEAEITKDVGISTIPAKVTHRQEIYYYKRSKFIQW